MVRRITCKMDCIQSGRSNLQMSDVRQDLSGNAYDLGLYRESILTRLKSMMEIL